MSQSAITVTPPNPTPPTNFSTTIGQTPPNAPAQTSVDDGTAGTLTVFAASRGLGRQHQLPERGERGRWHRGDGGGGGLAG